MPDHEDPAARGADALAAEPDIQELEKDSPVEQIPSELEDAASAPSHYEIVSIPADFTLEGLVTKWKKGQLKIPGFQRKFVWTQRQSSRLIESFLLGLPVPALFLYADPDTGDQQVIDGQQRLMSVVQFFGGVFQNANMGQGRLFRLVGIDDGSPYAGASAKDLEDRFTPAFAKLSDSVMRAFLIKQLDPTDATSVYHIFERLNTGGTRLLGQEIRNCVYHGALNELLCSLNLNPNWRRIIGKPSPDARMRDVEMILRFVGLYYFAGEYRKPMKDFLSTTMKRKRNLTRPDQEILESTFTATCEDVVAILGERPFHGHAGMNPAVFDALFTTIARMPRPLPADLKLRCDSLVEDRDFSTNASYRTTDADAVARRLELAAARLTNPT